MRSVRMNVKRLRIIVSKSCLHFWFELCPGTNVLYVRDVPSSSQNSDSSLMQSSMSMSIYPLPASSQSFMYVWPELTPKWNLGCWDMVKGCLSFFTASVAEAHSSPHYWSFIIPSSIHSYLIHQTSSWSVEFWAKTSLTMGPSSKSLHLM